MECFNCPRKIKYVMSEFMNSCINIEPGMERANDLFQAYVKWCKKYDKYQMTSTMFGMKMTKQFKKRKFSTGAFYYGLKILSECLINFKIEPNNNTCLLECLPKRTKAINKQKKRTTLSFE